MRQRIRWKDGGFRPERPGTNDNPLLIGSLLLTSLAVESHLGNNYALKVLKKALVSLSTLYKFKGNNFDGYILRSDAVCRDNWEIGLYPQGELSLPRYQSQFGQDISSLVRTKTICIVLLPPIQHIIPSCTQDLLIPPSHQRFYVKTNEIQWEYTQHFRKSEPSMDELVGLISAYSIIHDLVKDPSVQTMVKEQAGKLEIT